MSESLYEHIVEQSLVGLGTWGMCLGNVWCFERGGGAIREKAKEPLRYSLLLINEFVNVPECLTKIDLSYFSLAESSVKFIRIYSHLFLIYFHFKEGFSHLNMNEIIIHIEAQV